MIYDLLNRMIKYQGKVDEDKKKDNKRRLRFR